MNDFPTSFFAFIKRIVLGVLCLLFFAACPFFIYLAFVSLSFDKQCSTTQGTLDNEYIRHRTGLLVDYIVKYTFTVDGIAYKGIGRVSDKPTALVLNVFYDPNNPNKNKLKKQEFGRDFGYSLFCVVMGFIFKKLIGRQEN